MHEVYKTYAKYYDLFYQSKDYKKESSYILDLIKKYKDGSISLLDVGCGTGTHLLFLKDSIPNLVGIDLNQNILDVAASKSPNEIEYILGDMKDFSLDRSFDVLTSLYSVFNYNLTLDDAKKTLKNFHKHLNNDGLLILALYRTQNEKKRIGIDRGQKDDVVVEKINEYWLTDKNIETSNFTIKIEEGKKEFSFKDSHKLRMFSLKEIHKLLEETNFNLIAIYDNFTEKIADDDTRYQVVVARKR